MKSYPHMCRDDHPEVGFRETYDESERCPVCWQRDRADAAEQERDEAIAANHSVAVCRDHTREIVRDGCVICDLIELRARLTALADQCDGWGAIFGSDIAAMIRKALDPRPAA